MTRPFMTDPEALESLRGQQYLVLRPVAGIASFYDEEQSALRERLPGHTSPNAGHVTLRGFSEPDRVEALRDVLAIWAEAQGPVDLRVVAVDGFPPPFQILLARLARTPSLVGAYESLTTLLDSTELHRIGELPLEDWVFHLSLIYARDLDEQRWQEAFVQNRRDLSPGPTEIVTSAEYVWYDDDGEHIETLPLPSSGGFPARF